MAETPKVLTAEEQAQKDAWDAENNRQARESYIFMRKHAGYAMNEANAKTLLRQLKAMGFSKASDWTAANLEEVYEKVNPDLWTSDEVAGPDVPVTKEFDAPEPTVVAPTSFPWGLELTGVEGRKRVHDMSGTEFLKYSTGKFGEEFRAQVEALNLTQRGRF